MERGVSPSQEENTVIEQETTVVLSDDSALKGKTFWRHPWVRLLVGFSLALNGISWLILFFSISTARERVILHYNVYLGVDIIGAPYQAYWVPSVGLLFLCINVLLANFLYRSRERIAAYFLLLAGAMLGFGVIIASISLGIVNY